MKTQQTITNVRQIPVFLALSIASSVALVGCSFSLSTATLENIKTCSVLDHNEQCADDIHSFEQNTPILFATADLKYAPAGTNVTITWNYLGGEAGQAGPIDSVSLKTDSLTTLVTSSLTAPTQGWPRGDYEVVFSLNSDNAQPIRKQFSINNF